MVLPTVNGQMVEGGEVEQNLFTNGHLALFIDELFPDADTTEFEGTLTVTAQSGQVVATVLELGAEPGQLRFSR